MALFKGLQHSFVGRFINAVPKRMRIFVSTAIMTGLLLVSTFFDFTVSWWIWIAIFILFSYFLAYLSVFEGIDRVEWFMLFVMPVLFTVSFYLFYSLFPVRWLTRVPFMIFYAFGYYAIVLSSNIFNVGVEKSIQLYRAAFSVNFLFQTLLVFLAMQVVFSLKLNFILTGILAAGVTFPLITQLSWTVNPNEVYDMTLLKYSYFVCVFIFESVVLTSFLPLQTTIQSLFITATYYSLGGIIYHYIDHKLFRQNIREYAFVIGFVLVIALLTLQW